MMVNLQSEDIDATLKYGQVFTGKGLRAAIISVYVLSGIALAIMLTMLIGIPLTVGEFDSDSIATIVGGGSTIVFVSICMTCVLLYCRSGKKKVDLWLKDAVLLKAKTKSIGKEWFFRVSMVRKGVAIEVEFIYNYMRYIRQSTYNGKPACLPVFMKYANQTIMIAYSPKYDEVMFIKHKSVDKKHIGLKG